MPPRNTWSPRARAARARLAQLFHDREVLCGALVTMERTCGKATCRCQTGAKHRSLYLAVRVGEHRKMIYIPPRLEAWVSAQVEAWREAQGLLDTVSQACLERVLARKQEPPDSREG